MRPLLLASLLPLAACQFAGADDAGIAGTGSGSQRTFPVAGFTAIELAGADDVDVRVGGGFSVRAEGPAAQLATLRIERKGDTLAIGRRWNGISLGRGDKVMLHVTLPRLTGASIAGSGTMNVDRVQGAGFKADIAGSGTLAVAALAVDKAEVDLAGSGSLQAAGTAKALGIDITGSGRIDAAGLAAGSASVSIAGSGDVRATVDGPATVAIMGSGDVDLGPRARCTTTRMGSGSVRCGG